jgi:hypothetical protein
MKYCNNYSGPKGTGLGNEKGRGEGWWKEREDSLFENVTTNLAQFFIGAATNLHARKKNSLTTSRDIHNWFYSISICIVNLSYVSHTLYSLYKLLKHSLGYLWWDQANTLILLLLILTSIDSKWKQRSVRGRNVWTKSPHSLKHTHVFSR